MTIIFQARKYFPDHFFLGGKIKRLYGAISVYTWRLSSLFSFRNFFTPALLNTNRSEFDLGFKWLQALNLQVGVSEALCWLRLEWTLENGKCKDVKLALMAPGRSRCVRGSWVLQVLSIPVPVPSCSSAGEENTPINNQEERMSHTHRQAGWAGRRSRGF